MLERDGFETVIVTGGSTLNSSFAKAGLIDEVVLNVEPVIVGKGISLFHQEEFDFNLELLSVKELGNKIIQLHYKVRK